MVHSVILMPRIGLPDLSNPIQHHDSTTGQNGILSVKIELGPWKMAAMDQARQFGKGKAV